MRKATNERHTPGALPTLRRRLRVFAAAALVVVALVASGSNCGRGGDETIRIGAVLPLTGPLAIFGEPERAVLLQSVNELNSGPQGGIRGRKVELLLEDSRGTARDGVSAVQKVLLGEPAAVISSLTVVSAAAQQVLTEARTPQVALSVHPEIARRSRYTVRPYYGFEQEMRVLAEHFARERKLRVGVLWVLVPECEAAIENVLAPRLAELGGGVVASESYSFSDMSVRPQLMKIAAAEPDVVLVMDFGNLFGLILREAQNLEIRDRIVGNIGLLTAPPVAPELLEGVVFSGPSFVIEDSPQYRKFAADFKAATNLDATYDVLYTKDAFDMIVRALNESADGDGRVDPERTLASLRKMRSFEGVAGRMEIDPAGGNVNVSISMGVYQGGRITPLR